MELGYSWETNSCLASQENPRNVHKSNPNPVHALSSCFFKFHFNIIRPSMARSNFTCFYQTLQEDLFILMHALWNPLLKCTVTIQVKIVKLFPWQAVEAYRVEMLRIPHCLDSRFTDSGKVVSPTHQPRSTPQKHYLSASGTHFC
jgi:hypothetical protein